MGHLEEQHDNKIGAALFGATRQGVLRLMFGHTDQRFYQRQIIRNVGLGSGTVQRELEDLTGAGILKRTVEGRQTYYQANPGCPVFEELHRLVQKSFGVADVLRKAFRPLSDRIELAFIYGSVASGTERAASDIDVMIVGDKLSTEEVTEAFAETQKELQREVNPSIYPTEEFCRKLAEQHHFVTRIAEDGKNYFCLETMTTLKDWLKNGWLKEHKSSRQEIADLFAVADRDLAASQTPGLHTDWSFNIAYNAALQLATAALAASGYQAERANHH